MRDTDAEREKNMVPPWYCGECLIVDDDSECARCLKNQEEMSKFLGIEEKCVLIIKGDFN